MSKDRQTHANWNSSDEPPAPLALRSRSDDHIYPSPFQLILDNLQSYTHNSRPFWSAPRVPAPSSMRKDHTSSFGIVRGYSFLPGDGDASDGEFHIIELGPWSKNTATENVR
jgi:hypothetical protein